MKTVDAHLDIAYNAACGRDPRKPAHEQKNLDDQIATVGLPDLIAGNVGLVCATIFCLPAKPGEQNGYTNSDEARAQALWQLDWYRSCAAENLLRFVRTANDLPCDTGSQPVPETVVNAKEHGLSARFTNPLPIILLLEGADAIRSPADVAEWHDAGVRIVGLSWHRTRYAGGTGEPGALTDAGRDLVTELDKFGIIHDASHLAEESFWELLDRTTVPIIASHSNCRAIIGGGDRHLSDEMIRAIADRGGIIGINFFDKFLLPANEYGRRRANLNDVVRHVRHICDLVGNTNHVGLGTDMDGGLGRNEIPEEVQTSADLPRLSAALEAADFSAANIRQILGGNWTRFFKSKLL